MLKGEGEIKIVRRERVRIECEECAKPATRKFTYLMENARRNPASKAYGRDDCSRCEDAAVFVCGDCKPRAPDYMDWCAEFHVSDRFAHLFLRWHETEIATPVAA